jgi:hypothetical protein
MSVVERLKNALGLGNAPAGADRRQHPRKDGPLLTLKFGGEKYKSVDWSLGGCRIQTPPGHLRANQQVTGRIHIAGASERGKFVAEIVRIDAAGQASLRWLEMSPHIFLTMHGMGE